MRCRNFRARRGSIWRRKQRGEIEAAAVHPANRQQSVDGSETPPQVHTKHACTTTYGSWEGKDAPPDTKGRQGGEPK